MYREREETECVLTRMQAYTSCNGATWKYLRNFDIPPLWDFL